MASIMKELGAATGAMEIVPHSVKEPCAFLFFSRRSIT